jgi:hypothetical protein
MLVRNATNIFAGLAVKFANFVFQKRGFSRDSSGIATSSEAKSRKVICPTSDRQIYAASPHLSVRGRTSLCAHAL